LGGPKKASHFQFFVKKCCWKPVDEARFFIKFECNEEPVYSQLVLNIMCMTYFVTSSITVFKMRHRKHKYIQGGPKN